MIGNVLKIYLTKDIYIGYVDTISLNNLTNEPQIITKVLPLQKVVSKDNQTISQFLKYMNFIVFQKLIQL